MSASDNDGFGVIALAVDGLADAVPGTPAAQKSCFVAGTNRGAFLRWPLFLRGLLTNLANPKAVVCFGSVFSLFIGHDVSAGRRRACFC